MAQKSFVAAMIGYFGKVGGQTAMDFGRELTALSMDEKLQFAAMLRTQPGYEETTDPMPPKV